MADAVHEFEALRRCCAAALRGETGVVAPEAGRTLAERHRVVPLLAAGLAPDLRAAFRRRVLALAQQTVRLEQELAVLARLLSGAGVDFLILKGPAMARMAYPVPEGRAYDDLDLWVETCDLDTALRTLEKEGYRRTPPLSARASACARRAGIEVALVHPDRSRLIEVAHGWRALAPSRGAAREIRQDAVTLEIAGAKIRAPAPKHALIFACLHGAHHRWDRLAWVADVAGLWSRLSPAERDEVCAIAHRWRVETRVGLGLRLATEHFGVALDGRAAALVRAPHAEALFRRVRLEEIGPDTPRVSMMERLRFERDAQESALQRFRMMAGWIFTPTLGDIVALPLPCALAPLYAVIRPLRLLRHPWLHDWRKLAGRE